MRRGALDWLRELRERAEQREARALETSLARLAEARCLRFPAEGVRPGRAAEASALGLAAERRAWAREELARQARRVEEARARVRASRAAAEGLRRLLASRDEAGQRERGRRREALVDDDRLRAWVRRGKGSYSREQVPELLRSAADSSPARDGRRPGEGC